MKQSHKDIILYVVDDASTDNTYEKISQIEDERLKIIQNKINVGCYQSVNKVLDQFCNYDFFVIHGADDTSSLDRIEKQLKLIQNYAACGCLYTRKNQKKGFGHSTIMYSKEVFLSIGYYDNTRFGGDTEYFKRFKKHIGLQEHFPIVQEFLYFANGNGLTEKYKIQERLDYINKVNNNPIYCEFFSEKIIAGIASIPENIDMLEKVVESIINQVDILYVGLNNYKSVPEFLKKYDNKIFCTLLINEKGDAAKYYMAEYCQGYYLSIDDDILYPKDYVKKMVSKIREYNFTSIITAHGRTMKKGKIKSYYNDHDQTYNCFAPNDKDTFIDVPGSGVAAYHTSMLKIKYQDFENPNMADIYLMKFAKQNNLQIMCVEHTFDWLQYLSHEKTICRTYKKNDKIQTNLYNSII